VNYAGDVGDVVFVSADDIGSRQMDGRQIYVVEEDAEDGEEATVQVGETLKARAPSSWAAFKSCEGS
jgi:hypothetical protein